MNRNFYRDFLQKLLWSQEVKRIGNVSVYGTSCLLFQEYHALVSQTTRYAALILRDADLFSVGIRETVDFYFNLDMMTYVPFEKAGHDLLGENLGKDESGITELKCNKILSLLLQYDLDDVDQAEKEVCDFFAVYHEDTLPLNCRSLAILSLRCFHRLITLMSLGAPIGGMMGIQKKMDEIFEDLRNDIAKDAAKVIDTRKYLPPLDKDPVLTDEMIDYLTLCAERGLLS